MGAVEWNKKEDLLAEQALRHLKVYLTSSHSPTLFATLHLTLSLHCRLIVVCSGHFVSEVPLN